jgi:hypothetical protein
VAHIILDEQNHEYRVNGVVYPSVSEIMLPLTKIVYDDQNQFAVDRAAERGQAVHKACEALDVYGRVECEDDIVPYIKAYLAFKKEVKPEWTDIEKSMHHPDLYYAGTMDRVGTIKGERCIVDFKTSYVVNKRLAVAQLGGYAILAEEQGTRTAILHLKPDETYKLIDIPFVPSIFMSCLELYNHMESTRSERYKLRMKKEKSE